MPGAAAVKSWGHGTEVLQDLITHPRLPTPVPPPMGTSKKKSDRNITIKKRKEAKKREDEAKKGTKSMGRNAAASEELDIPVWDEDEVMLFLWGNPRAAQERYIKRSEFNRGKVEARNPSIMDLHFIAFKD